MCSSDLGFEQPQTCQHLAVVGGFRQTQVEVVVQVDHVDDFPQSTCQFAIEFPGDEDVVDGRVLTFMQVGKTDVAQAVLAALQLAGVVQAVAAGGADAEHDHAEAEELNVARLGIHQRPGRQHS